MKKYGVLICVLLLLTGCTPQEFETISDVYTPEEVPRQQQVMLQLPDEAAVPTVQSEDAGALYLCDGYTMTVQTLEAGDLENTFRQTTGFSRDALTVMEYRQDDLTRYECVWTCAGENADQVGKAAILSDGNYHYVVSVMADASEAGKLQPQWQEIFASFRLASADTVLNTGS